MKSTLLSTEVCNRFLQLPLAERVDPLAAVMRLTVEVTRELLKDCHDSVDEFLRLCGAHPRGMH